MPTAPGPSAPQLARLLTGWRGEGTSARALAERIGVLLEDGRLAAGRRLPAERVLAAELGVSRTTVTAAYGLLRERGRLVSVQGSGSALALPDAPRGSSGSAPAVADLSNAIPPAWPALPGYVAAAAARLPEVLDAARLDYQGLLELREGLAARYTDRGLPTGPDRILVTSGAQHGIGLVLHALLRRADRLVVDVPSYPHALDACRAAGARIVPLAMPDARPDVDEWERVLARTRPEFAYLMPDFHNPTGSTLDEEERRRILRAAAAAGTVLIVDETTAELAIDPGEPHPPFAALAVGTGAHVVTVGSVGKTVWHGLRIGWIRADPRTVAAIAAARPARDLGTPVLDQLVVAALLPDVRRVLADRAVQLRATRAAVLERLGVDLPDWRAPVPAGGLSIWAGLPEPRSSLLVPAAAAVGVRIVAGPRFGVDGAFERNLRIPIGGAPGPTAAAVGLLAEAWRGMGAHHPVQEAFAPVL
ncbi:PLP-dependent aminotransferase family protein [Amnibacterium kyonggiense]|uniref:GntR family transcriptional regulator n=1 Tax=Amnibacterium kyonggiense TaxID=595671 RepID=A0A4R7FLV6_9MICO|nr:PLP-dependent aminotransferase family protein [Amnibacterium kyonggiense]TDS77368.1 GntR family transcriptional regulator [Amnibacterium kyonggiense]